MPFVYFSFSDGRNFLRDEVGRCVRSEAEVEAQAKRILAKHLLACGPTTEPWLSASR